MFERPPEARRDIKGAGTKQEATRGRGDQSSAQTAEIAGAGTQLLQIQTQARALCGVKTFSCRIDRKARVIHDPVHWFLATGERRKRRGRDRGEYRLFAPAGLENQEMHRQVHRADVARMNPGRHRFDTLAATRQQQALEVTVSRLCTIGAGQRYKIASQFRSDRRSELAAMTNPESAWSARHSKSFIDTVVILGSMGAPASAGRRLRRSPASPWRGPARNGRVMSSP